MKFRFPTRRPLVLAAGLLAAQGVLFYTLSHGEAVPLSRPLNGFPPRVEHWVMTEDGVIDQETRDVLKADDYLTRTYTNDRSGEQASLYVAFFKTQQTGQAPHSPKNCLPGNGWVPSSSRMAEVAVPGRAQPIQVNQYVVSKGATQALVLYWYQSHGRVVANEYKAKAYVVVDSLRYHRSDTALVRVIVDIGPGGVAQASAIATDFVRRFFGPLTEALPG